jgi:hypothetical protein
MSGNATPGSGSYGLHHDGLCDAGIQPETGIADLAEEVRALADEPNFPVFAKSHFAKSVIQVIRPGELLDTNKCPLRHAVQRAKITRRTTLVALRTWMGVAHL